MVEILLTKMFKITVATVIVSNICNMLGEKDIAKTLNIIGFGANAYLVAIIVTKLFITTKKISLDV